MMTTSQPVIIVGGGIVGLSTAYYLNKHGIACTIIDAKGAGQETSFGNAGSVSVGNIFPQSMPGIMSKAVKMLFNPLAPLKVNWFKPATVLPWIAQFVFAARRARVLKIVDALTEINRDSARCWSDIAEAVDAQKLVQAVGYLHVYNEASTFESGQWEREIMQQRGVRFDVLDRAGLLKLEPHLGDGFNWGVFQHDSLAVQDPGEFCQRLGDYLKQRGVPFVQASVSRIETIATGSKVVTDHGTFNAAKVVIAAGVWSKRLLAPLGINVPVIAARGYHVMFEKQEPVLTRPTLWAERYMVMTPMQKGVRVTSIKELTTLDSDPRFQFIRRLIPEARKLFPRLQAAQASEWMGNRPCTPDSLPIIDKLNGCEIYVACGHGHMGLTQGPVTGKLVAQWLRGEKTDINLAPFSLRRF